MDSGLSRFAELGTSTAPARGCLVAESTNWPSLVLSAPPIVPSAFFTVTGVKLAGLVCAITFGPAGAGAGGGPEAAATPMGASPGAGGAEPTVDAVVPCATGVAPAVPSGAVKPGTSISCSLPSAFAMRTYFVPCLLYTSPSPRD